MRAMLTTIRIPALAVALALALAGCSQTATSTSGSAIKASDPVVKAAKADAKSDAKAQKPVETVSVQKPVERYTDRSAKARATRTGEVYMLRGLADVFSRGMDEMAVKLNRAGVYSISDSYANWQPIADEILERNKRGEVSYPVVIMGHSLGGNAAPQMATYLGRRGVKVSYVVTFDPTESESVGAGVGKVVNYYLPNGKNRVRAGAGFSGKLDNVSLAGREDITHTTIEKNRGLQARVISYTVGLTKKRKS